MKYNSDKVKMFYAISGFHRRGGKMTPRLMAADMMMSEYSSIDREFTLTDDELYETIDMITKTIHWDERKTFEEDFDYVFEDERASFVLEQLRKHVLNRIYVRIMLRLMERS